MREYFSVKSKKGMSLPMILIVITVVLSMIVTLLGLSVQQLKATNSENHIEHTYFAGDSMIEIAISKIQKNLDTPSFLNSIPYNGYQDYAIKIRDKLVDLSTDPDPTNDIVSKKENISIGASNQNAISIVKSIENVSALLDTTTNTVKFKLRINVSSDYHSGYKSGSKETTAIKEFEVDLPAKKPKLAAINSIGDLVATGLMDSKIFGDVKVYGSAPKEPVKVEQEYYGGIYSQLKAKLRIDGNAFVRSFIRTGIKDYSGDDESKIYVTKSAIAQGLHSFGSKSYIYVHKDAYTFDDVEMNAEDSAIIINRNLFALERGDGVFHDSSSAIVNSAPLYFLNSPESFMSKIVVNGPVYLNGGTFRVNENGEILYKDHITNGIEYYGQPQIEDGSIAWDTTEDAPYYSTFEDPLMHFYAKPAGPGSYHDILYDNKTHVKGYGNIIQGFSKLTTDDDASIDTFINGDLRDAMNQKYSDSLVGEIDRPIDNKIMGFTSFEIAANGMMYFMDRGSETGSSFKRPTNSLGEYSDAYLDYEKVRSSYKRVEWENDWDTAIKPNLWDDVTSNTDAYINKIPYIFSKIKSPLYDLTQELVTRSVVYPQNGNTASINHTYTTLPGNTDSTFKTYQNKLAVLSNPILYPDFIDVSNDNKTEVDLAAKVAAQPSKFYVFFNSDPDQDLVISGAIKGLVFSAGRVILRDGGELRGCIIAAGKGYNGVAVTGSQADFIPKIDSSNVNLLDDGTFAGVLFQGSATIDFHPDPALGPESAQDVFFNEFASTASAAFVYELRSIFE